QVVIVGMKVDGDRLDYRSGLVAEVGQHETGRLETPVPVAQGDPDSRVAEADDVRLAVAVQVGEVAGVERDPPSLVVAEPSQHELRAASSGDRNPDAVVAEADQIGL